MLRLPGVCRNSLPLRPINAVWRNLNVSAVRSNDVVKGKIKALQRRRRMLMGLRKELVQKHMKVEKKLANAEKNIEKWQRELKSWRQRGIDVGRDTE